MTENQKAALVISQSAAMLAALSALSTVISFVLQHWTHR